jgi:hypothetical protein
MTFTVRLVRGFDDVAQLAEDVRFIAVFEPANVQHNVDFLRALIDRSFDFVSLRVRRLVAPSGNPTVQATFTPLSSTSA